MQLLGYQITNAGEMRLQVNKKGRGEGGKFDFVSYFKW